MIVLAGYTERKEKGYLVLKVLKSEHFVIQYIFLIFVMGGLVIFGMSHMSSFVLIVSSVQALGT